MVCIVLTLTIAAFKLTKKIVYYFDITGRSATIAKFYVGK